MEHEKAQITVRISGASYPHSQDYCANTNIDLYTYRELLQGLDHPRPDSDPFTAMLCTDQVTIKRVKKLRQDYAELISKTLTDMLIQAFEKHDTVCGYAKEDREHPNSRA